MPQAEACHIHSELEVLAAAGQRGHHAHGFQVRGGVNDAVALPYRTEAAVVADVHPAPETSGIIKCKIGYANTGSDPHIKPSYHPTKMYWLRLPTNLGCGYPDGPAAGRLAYSDTRW